MAASCAACQGPCGRAAGFCREITDPRRAPYAPGAVSSAAPTAATAELDPDVVAERAIGEAIGHNVLRGRGLHWYGRDPVDTKGP